MLGLTDMRQKLYQQYLELCRKAGHVLSHEEARRQGFDTNDLMYYYGNFEALSMDVEWDLKQNMTDVKIIKHPTSNGILRPTPKIRSMEEIKRERMVKRRKEELQRLLRLNKEARNKEAKNMKAKGARYTKEDLLKILREIYEELDGQVTQKNLVTLARKKQIPAWATFLKILGPRERWDSLVGWGSKPKATRKAPKPAKKVARPKVATVNAPMAEAPVAIPALLGTKMELKLTVPGMPAPIIMEFSIK